MAWLKPWCFNKKQGRNDPPNRGETTHGRNDSGRNDPWRNDPRAKRLTGETTHGRNDPGHYQKAYSYQFYAAGLRCHGFLNWYPVHFVFAVRDFLMFANSKLKHVIDPCVHVTSHICHVLNFKIFSVINIIV